MKQETKDLIRTTEQMISAYEGIPYTLKLLRRKSTDYTPEQLTQKAVTVAANVFQVTRKEITGKCRVRACADARKIIIKYLREEGYSLKEIGELVGGRDHSTICNSIAKYTNLSNTDPAFIQRDNEFRKRMAR